MALRGQPAARSANMSWSWLRTKAPVLAPGVPVYHDPLCGQVEHPEQGVLVGDAGFVFGNMPELVVGAFDNVGRVFDLPDLRETVPSIV